MKPLTPAGAVVMSALRQSIIRALGITDQTSDAVLLRAAVGGEPEVFQALVARHGPMVLRVCHRIVGDRHEAEDAFQAVFLLLSRRAGGLKRPERLAAWLYGTARRIALNARTSAMRRSRRKNLPTPKPTHDPLNELSGRELMAALDEEIERLPEAYRLPLLLCFWQGLTQDQAARRLGWTTGSVKGRIERGRKQLAARLTKRGLAPTILLVAAVTPTVVPGELLASTALLAIPGAVVPATALALTATAGTSKVLTASAIAVLLAGAGIVGLAGGFASPQVAVGKTPETPNAPPSVERVVPRVESLGDPLPEGAVARLGTVRFRHDGEASSVVFSPDGKTLAATSVDGSIILWNAQTGQEIQRVRGFPNRIVLGSSIAFSPDSKLIVGFEDHKHVSLWDVKSGIKSHSFALFLAPDKGPLAGTDIHHTIRFSPDGKTLAVAGNHYSYLFDVVAGKPLHLLKGNVGGIVFSPDSQSFVCQLIDLNLGINELRFRIVRTLAWTWRLNVPAGAGQLKGRSEELICEMAFSPDGRTLATSGTDRILLWDAGAGKLSATLESKMGQVKNLTFTPDGRTLLACGESSGKVHVWDLATGAEQRQLDPSLLTLRSMALSPDGKTVACGSVYGTVRLMDLVSGKDLFADQPGHDAQVNSVDFSSDGKFLVSGGENKQIRIWDTATGKPLRVFRDATPRQVALSPNGKRLALLSPGMFFQGKFVDVWDAETGQSLFRLHPGDLRAVTSFRYSGDGKTIVSTGWAPNADNRAEVICKLTVWDADSGESVKSLSVAGIRPESLALSYDGKLAAVGGASAPGIGLIRICDIQKGNEILSLPVYGHVVTCLCFSPDGRLLVSGGSDSTVRLWELSSGKEVFAQKREPHAVIAVAFAPNGRIVASAVGPDRPPDVPSEQDGIHLWDISTGNELQHLRGYNSTVTSMAFAPDGARLASGLRNTSILLWKMPTSPTVNRRGLVGQKELESFWAQLASNDVAAAQRAMWTLAGGANEVIAFISGHLKPARPPDAGEVKELIHDLDNDKFSVRQRAAATLAKSGSLTAPLLKEALTKNPTAQVKQQLETLLESADCPLASGTELQSLRAIAILERVATPAARQHLQLIAAGAPGARLTLDAKASLERIKAK